MSPARHHRLVCLDIADPEAYATYRRHMAPILARHGGRFVLDVAGGEATHHPAPFEPGRILVIGFPDAAAAAAFYADPAYVEVRRRWFEPAVAATWSAVLGRSSSDR